MAAPLNIGPGKLAVTYGPPFMEILTLVPSQPATMKYQVVVLAKGIAELTEVTVDPSELAKNTALRVLRSRNTIHSLFPSCEVNFDTNSISRWPKELALAQKETKK